LLISQTKKKQTLGWQCWLAFELQRYIQMLTEVFNSGYCQEIIAGLHVDHLSWMATDDKDQELLATVTTEKTAHFKTDKVPISHHVKHFIKFHLQQVRPILLALAAAPQPMDNDNNDDNNEDNDDDNNDDNNNNNNDNDNYNNNKHMDEADKHELLALWISSHGAPLKFNSYTTSLKVVSHAFHPGLNLTSLSFHQAYITAFYKGCIEFDGAAADFWCNMSILLNVAETVMEMHYDWHSAGPMNCVTQDLLSGSVNLKDAAVCDQLAQTNAKLLQAIDWTKRPLVEMVTQRLCQCTADDEEWTKQMAAAGLTMTTPLGGQFSV
jgi:hypothetical protein